MIDATLRQQYREDGAVMLRGALDAAQLARCREALDWAVANPGPNASGLLVGTEQQSFVDNGNPAAKPKLDALVAELPLGRAFAELWGSRNVWYFAEEVFIKTGGVGPRTFWHQDTSYLPWGGMHWGNAWISFESVPKANALEVVRGSHLGTRYDGPTFRDPDDPTDPLHGGDALPRLPDIEAERKADPGAWDVLSWATEPGDVLLLHPNSLHGGAAVDDAFPDRHTIVFRFFGDDATFHPLPEVSRSGFARNGMLFQDEMSRLEPQAPFRAPIFRQVVSA